MHTANNNDGIKLASKLYTLVQFMEKTAKNIDEKYILNL